MKTFRITWVKYILNSKSKTWQRATYPPLTIYSFRLGQFHNKLYDTRVNFDFHNTFQHSISDGYSVFCAIPVYATLLDVLCWPKPFTIHYIGLCHDTVTCNKTLFQLKNVRSITFFEIIFSCMPDHSLLSYKGKETQKNKLFLSMPFYDALLWTLKMFYTTQYVENGWSLLSSNCFLSLFVCFLNTFVVGWFFFLSVCFLCLFWSLFWREDSNYGVFEVIDCANRTLTFFSFSFFNSQNVFGRINAFV